MRLNQPAVIDEIHGRLTAIAEDLGRMQTLEISKHLKRELLQVKLRIHVTAARVTLARRKVKT